MSDDLLLEQEALAAIYDSPETLTASPDSPDDTTTYLLRPPTSVVSPQLSLRVHIPADYPATKPSILDGGVGVELARETLDSCWREGEVCFYDLIEGLREVLGGEEPERTPSPPREEPTPTPPPAPPADPPREPTPPPAAPADEPARSSTPVPVDPWVVTDAIEEKKSIFVGHALKVTTAEQAKTAIQNLILGNKKLQKATHNITAYRIVNENGNVVQDNDDDGETAAGSRMAHLLQLMDVKDVVVVVSRWYGGVKLGPDRFRLINMAAREALVKGGWVEEKKEEPGKKGKKKGKK